MKTKSKKVTVAAIAGGVVMCLLTAFAGLFAVNTLLDSDKTDTFAVSESVHKLSSRPTRVTSTCSPPTPTMSPCAARRTG